MPIYTRQQLRRLLGSNHVGDTYVGSVTGSTGLANFSLNLIDAVVADLSLSGQNPYVGAWLFFTGPAGEVRIATFNCGSGAYLSLQNSFFAGTFPSGMPYERHEVIRPSDKDRAVDEGVKALRVRQEVALAANGSLLAYPYPPGVEQVLDAYVFQSPAAPDRGQRRIGSLALVMTATGPEVRLGAALGGSAQLVLDAITTVTLGASDAATLSVPDERLLLYKAEAVCWDLAVRDAPRGTADEYRKLAAEAAGRYNALVKNFKAPVDRPLRL